MLRYNCIICKYQTNLKANYTRHLNSKKHIKQSNKLETPKEVHEKMTTNDHKMTTNDHKMTTNDHKMTINEKTNNDKICVFCGKNFSSKAHKRRHELHYCKKNNEYVNDSLLIQLKKEKKEKEKLYKHIESLLEKVGDTINNNTINQTNNIVLNNYGNEDLSHITSQVLDKLITAPCQMINNLTKMIHFNNDKPENMNIYIPNKKQKYLKIFKDDKWILEEKKERIPDIIDKNYFILDNHYEQTSGEEKLDRFTNKNYKLYQNKIDKKDSDIHKKEYDSCELEILNNSKLVMDQHNIKN